MELKKKLAEAKEKIKAHGPAISAVVSSGAIFALVIVNHRMKSEHAAQIELWMENDRRRDEVIHIPEDATERLIKGRTLHLTSDFADFCLLLQKHDHPTED